MLMNKNIPYYLIAIGLFVLLKFWIGTFDNDQLQFLLRPTDMIFGLLTGSHSVYSSESGFFYEKFNILIDKSCSGYNFLLLCFIMLYFQIIKYEKQLKYKFLLLFVSLFIAYILTLLINSSRIIISVFIQNGKFDLFNFEPHIIHESIGVLTYLIFLVITYFLTNKILEKKYAKST